MELPSKHAGAPSELQAWAGRSEERIDEITSMPVRLLAATLDRRDLGAALPGTPLPPLWHWLFFLPCHGAGEIGADGHPKRGGFLPPVPLPRRMWAGGRLKWDTANPLRVGDTVSRLSRIASVTQKSGRSGDLIFVNVRHELSNARGLALTEDQDLVYRAAPQPGDSPPALEPPSRAAAWERELVPDEVLLFRYSALTFNGHRIHYDRPYATGVEGYSALVVHGPLIATLLAGLLERHSHDAKLRSFEFKAVRPSFDARPLRLRGEPAPDGRKIALWAQDHDDWLAMRAEAEIER